MMRWSTLIAAIVAAVVTEASTLTPPLLPLIVRNPYLSTWLSHAREAPWENWPVFYTGQSVGFSVLAAIPETDTVYPLLGRPQDSLPRNSAYYNVSYPTYLGASFDASTTNLSYLIPAADGGSDLEVTLSFLSPITPTSTLRQSIPASYVSVLVEGSFDIDVYIDLNGQWVSGDRGNEITWTFEESKDNDQHLKTFKVKRSTEQLFTEFADRGEWGTLHFTAPAGTRHQVGTSAVVRQSFSKTGSLQDVIDENFRQIMDEEPVFAFSKSFKLNSTTGSNARTSDSVLFTIAHIQDPVVQYASARGLTYMRPLWQSWFTDADEVLAYHYYDYVNAAKLAGNYSRQLEQDALQSGSENYKDIVALSARQVLGATSFSGTPDNPILFLKEISSNGNFQTVDVIFPAFPFFLYTNPRWLAYLLEPLIEHQLSGQYPNQYSMHDLGSHFPNATGHADGNDEYMPVEECGDMLIMGLALVNSLKYNTQPATVWSSLGHSYKNEESDHAFGLSIDDGEMDNSWDDEVSAFGDKEARKWIGKSYNLWKQWTGYLVRETLIPSNQLCTDDFAGWLANQTNLALKGIIGIRAMSQIADLMGETEDAKYYKNISDVYIEKWADYGLSRDKTHAKLAYTWYGSWTTLYNIFADSLLCFHLPESSSGVASDGSQLPLGGSNNKVSRTAFIDEKIYKAQSDWYHNVRQKYGLPLDSRHLYTKSDWEFFATAVASRDVREEILESIALWVNETATDRPLTDLYDTEGEGGFPGVTFFARPVVGGHFSFLALERACGGKAVAGLEFLNEEPPKKLDVANILKPLHDGEL